MQAQPLSYIKYKRLLFSVNDYFLCCPLDLKASINYCIQCPENIQNALNEFYTLLIDLEQPLDTIWENIHQRTRSEINSFLNNQSYQYGMQVNLSREQLSHFIHLFDEFAGHKGIRKAEAFRLKAYNTHKLLGISFIKQQNEFVCINFYRINKQRATNLYSFHLKHKSKDAYSASHYGRAHRALHWLDIQNFKKEAVQFYDFCGWYAGKEDEALLNINKFKEQFTRHKVKEYSGVIYTNKLLLILKRLKEWTTI